MLTSNSNSTFSLIKQLYLRKESLLHTWRVKGLSKYLHYMKNFDQTFEAITDDISFKSESVDGKWYCPIMRTQFVHT